MEATTRLKAMIIRTQLLIGGLLIIFNLNGQNLEQHKWQHRLLIIETTNKTNAAYKNQIKEFVHAAAELADRKLIIYELVGDKYKKTDYLARENDTDWKVIDEVNKKFWNITNTFKVQLIGLDGGIKLEQKEILKKEILFAVIDAMPMRKWELKNKEKEKNE